MDGTGRLFEPLVPFLREHYDVRVITYPDDAARYDELERAVGVPPTNAIVVGESFGGPLALRIARQGALPTVLVATFLRPPVAMLPPAWLVARAHPPPALAIRLAMLERTSAASLVAAVRAAVGSVPARTIAARLEALAHLDAREDLRSTQGPVHWLAARRDRLVGPRATELARSLSAALVVEWIDGPHLLAQTRPADVARAIDRAAVAS